MSKEKYAVNKAAEEGELPYGYVYECVQPGTDGKGWSEFFSRKPVKPQSGVRNIKELYDRAARPVANKAEVEPKPTAWLATDLDGRGDVAFTKEEAERRAGHGCNEFFPLFDAAPSVPVGAVPSIDTPALNGLLIDYRGAGTRVSAARVKEAIIAHIDQHVASQVQAAFEAAAKVCDEQASLPECPERANYCADAIRALKFTPSISPSGEGAALAGPVALTDERIKQVHAKTLAQTIDHNGKRPADFDVQFARAIADEVAAQAGQVAVPDEPDMLWQTDDSERFAHGADEFASDYAADCLHPGEEAVVDVDCAIRASKRTMNISVVDKGGDDYRVEWKWLDRTAPSPASESLHSPQEAAGTEKGATDGAPTE